MKRRSLFTLACVAMLSLLAMPSTVLAQPDIEPAEPFKVGTFAVGNEQFAGLVMRDDSLIVDLVEANKALELMPQYVSVAASSARPRDSPRSAGSGARSAVAPAAIARSRRSATRS